MDKKTTIVKFSRNFIHGLADRRLFLIENSKGAVLEYRDCCSQIKKDFWREVVSIQITRLFVKEQVHG